MSKYKPRMGERQSVIPLLIWDPQQGGRLCRPETESGEFFLVQDDQRKRIISTRHIFLLF